MAASNVEPEQEWSDRGLDTAEDTLVAMETLLATLRAFEDVLRQQETSTASSTEYCDNFCQALIHYAGSRNSMEHGLPLLEVYCLSINCFAAARSHLTTESDKVALVLKRLALSCFELLLSVPENEIPYEAWVQFHHSVQNAHDTLLRYGSTDLQALLQITGEGGAWSNPVLNSLLSGQLTSQEEVDAYITLEGEGFMEMRVKHLEKMGEIAKAVVLAKSCTECSFISNQATFRQTFVSLLCHLLPSEEAIMEISRLDCKDVLEITCNLETEGEENTAFIFCTTFLTQQLQQQSHYCSWELTQLWSKLQKRIDPSLLSLLERCLQLGAIAKTVHHLLYLVRVIQAEAEDAGVPASVELCVKALQLPKQQDSDTRISICKTMSCLLPGDLEVLRACQLTEFLLGPSQEVFSCLEELYLRPDQKLEQENEVIPNSLRCELLLALKAHWPFDPEFWDWKTLKYHCVSLLGIIPESEGEEEELVDKREQVKQERQEVAVKVETEQKWINGNPDGYEQQGTQPMSNLAEVQGKSEAKKHKFCCKICKRSVTGTQLVHHSIRHTEDNSHPCPVCLERFESRKELVPHLKQHILSETHLNKNNVKKEDKQKQMDEDDDDIEPGEISIDPSLMLYYKSTHDPDVLDHIVQQANTVKDKNLDDDEHVTFDYIEQHFKLQNRDEYPCPGTGCTRIFKHSKYLYVHLKSEHKGDENVKYFQQSRDKREKCVFCRRHFVSAYHHRKHRRVHYDDFEAQRKAKRKLFKTVSEPLVGLNKLLDSEEIVSRDTLSSPSVSCASPMQESDHKESKPTMTLVAVCFDGSKFTCGFEKCGMTFSRARDVQRHLKCAHPEHLKLENKEYKHEKQQGSKSKVLKTETEPDDEQKGKQEGVEEAESREEKTEKKNIQQAGLVRHLQVVHHYNRSQLMLEKDFDTHHSPEVKKEPARKRPLPNSDEPQPQYKCHFANCRASYHLKSSLVRHTRDSHSQPPQLIKCKYKGCTKVFSRNEALKKHTLYSHYEYYDSLVVRLQSTHKKSVSGCQKKLIVTPKSPEKEAPGSPMAQASSAEPEVTPKPEEVAEQSLEGEIKSGDKNKKRRNPLVYRSYEEALQMCQDRCMRGAYPCMVQNCDSVVTYVKSLQRHYVNVHRMGREHLLKNQNKLVFNAEKLEELIQSESARLTLAGSCTPNVVRKIEYQAEEENPGGQDAPMSLLSIKAETQVEDIHHPLGLPEDGEEEKEVLTLPLPPVERNGVLVGADEVLYGEPSTEGHTEDPATAVHISPKQEERLSWDKIKPLLRPLTVDLSPPCSLRFTTEDGFHEASSNKDGGKMLNGSATAATPLIRQPLKRKNELSEQPSNVIDPQPRSHSPRPFDITAYKPIGFESSFLKFIQDSSPNDKNPGAVKRRDAFRRSCSVKENNQLGISHTRSRRTHSPLLKPHAMNGDFTSVQNLKSILDKALAGCGDLAIKQLQYLRPVVLLGRPVCTTTPPDLFPSDPNGKLLLGT
ncbi:unnamed protein product [Pleuronectes platessa]|uniref:C2H2-type domain-containing protein n=1 Tax=Pleuronectes platessa TaxID=8262 RepID=A0A9N7UKQ4_PLEPL|nr:unnamed protein product [Pleuronectes platessa]